MFDTPRLSIASRFPKGSYLFFALVAGLMLSLGVWSALSAPRTRALPDEAGARGRLQSELRALAGAPPLPLTAAQAPAGTVSTGVEPASSGDGDVSSWKWILLVVVIGCAFATWAVVNFYLGPVDSLDEEESGPAAPLASRSSHSSSAWMKAAVRMARDAIVSVEAGGRIATANPAAEALLGYDAGVLPGKRIFDVLPDLGSSSEDLRRFSQVAAPTKATALKKDGAPKAVRLALHRVEGSGGGRFLAVFSPQEEAAVAPASISPAPEPAPPAAAPGINRDALHDLENQIVMLSGYSELTLAGLMEGDPGRADAEAVARAAARAALLCHEVAPFAHPSPHTLDLNAFAVACAARLSGLLDSGCQVTGRSAPGAAEVWTDADLLERSLGSLAWRAQEWAGGLESVTLSVANGRLDLRMVPKGDPSAATRAAFDRLAAIDWIEKLNGTIEMEEHSGAGIRFRIWLPAAAQARTAAPRERSHAAD